MGIMPIVGLNSLIAPQPVGSGLEVRPMQKIENTFSIGDETYSPSEGRGESDNGDETEPTVEDANAEALQTDNDPVIGISFFA